MPLIIYATRGSTTSTATVLINRDAATVYAEAVKTVKQRGYTQITKQDDAKYFLEGTRKGKNATLQVIPVGSDQSRIIITIENDKDATGINEAVEATRANLPSIGCSVRRTKELRVDRIRNRHPSRSSTAADGLRIALARQIRRLSRAVIRAVKANVRDGCQILVSRRDRRVC